MRGRTLALIIAVMLLSTGCDWLQWANGPGHPGSNFEPSVVKTTLAERVAVPFASVPTTTPAVITNGILIVGHNGALTAFDTQTNGVVWSAPLPEGSTAGSAPAIDGASRTVFVVVATSSHPLLLGFDVDGIRSCNSFLHTCSPIFSAQLGSSTGPATPPLLSAGKVFAQGPDTLDAFAANGQSNCTTSLGMAICTPLWSAPTSFAASGVGPAARGSLVYAAISSGGSPGVGAFNEATGALVWTGTTSAAVTASPSISGDGKVLAPTGPAIEAFAGNGCGVATCAPLFQLVARTGDPAGEFLGAAAVDPERVYATSSNGTLSAWPVNGCSAPACQPTYVVPVNAPTGGSTTYAQTPILANGSLFVLGQRVVEDVDHVALIALDVLDGSGLTSWDLGAGGFGAGIASPSVAWNVLYAPTDQALVAVRPSRIEPLASLETAELPLAPAFSPSITDYVLRCLEGTNSVTFTMTAVPGGSVQLTAPTTTERSASQTVTVPLVENQAAVIQAFDAQNRGRQYWVRCLPHDFPAITVERHPAAGEPTPGWYLIGNNFRGTPNDFFVMVLDTNGTPVWYRRAETAPANVTLLGQNRLAYFNADRFDILSLPTNTLQSVATVGMTTDTHELLPMPGGNALLMSYPLKSGVDLTGLSATPTPGPDSTIQDCVLQEINPAGEVVWQWTASDHVDPVTETTFPASMLSGGTRIWDVFHCNSIDARPNGDVLVSVRHLNAILEVRRTDGAVIWKMGGTPTNKDGAAIIEIQNDPSGTIVLPHDARYLPNGNVSLYDNQRTGGGVPARAVEFAVDFGTNVAQPVFWFTSPDGSPSCCMGSFRRYPDGHSVVGWGLIPSSSPRVFTEIDADGDAVLDVHFAPGTASYRAAKVPTSRLDLATLRRTAGQG